MPRAEPSWRPPRARVIAAADDARRRIERDLHDGAQQRLVTLSVALRTMEATMPTGSDEQRAEVGSDRRQSGRGRPGAPGVVTRHPSSRPHAGWAFPRAQSTPASLASSRHARYTLRARLPDQVEAAAYYTVSEALTNASKHASPTRVWVAVQLTDGTLHLSIRDDGVGGVDPSRGSGLTALKDRIEALACHRQRTGERNAH